VLAATAIKHLNVYSHLLKTGMTIETTGGWMWDIHERFRKARTNGRRPRRPRSCGFLPASEIRYASER
jgi:hypothetical protein